MGFACAVLSSSLSAMAVDGFAKKAFEAAVSRFVHLIPRRAFELSGQERKAPAFSALSASFFNRQPLCPQRDYFPSAPQGSSPLGQLFYFVAQPHFLTTTLKA